MRIILLLAMAAGFSFLGANCGGDGTGDPCVPEDEYLTGFSGFSQSEVNVESRSFQCLSRVCLVNHFQGRVSCPYGQTEDPDAKGSGLSTCMGTEAHRVSADCQPGGALHRQSCQVPDRDGARWEDRIIPPVEPQLLKRQAHDTVYCSCRCDGEGKGDFCSCPNGFKCEKLVEDLDLGRGELAGSYCILEDTVYDPGVKEFQECDPNVGQYRCNSRFNIELNGTTTGTNQRVGSCLPSGAACDNDQTCCGAPRPVECNDQVGSEDRNCNGSCVDCGALAPGRRCCEHGTGDSTALEPIQEVPTEDCPKSGVCGQ